MNVLAFIIACALAVLLIVIDVRHYQRRTHDAHGTLSQCRRDKQDGRVRLVPLVLLAGLAFLAWLCRDLIWLVWAMFTTTVH